MSRVALGRCLLANLKHKSRNYGAGRENQGHSRGRLSGSPRISEKGTSRVGSPVSSSSCVADDVFTEVDAFGMDAEWGHPLGGQSLMSGTYITTRNAHGQAHTLLSPLDFGKTVVSESGPA